jgi:glucose-6-phosphate 1-dehydrogenase
LSPICVAGKALDERKAEVRIQFKEVPASIFSQGVRRNELVVRIQPDEAIWLKVANKMWAAH